MIILLKLLISFCLTSVFGMFTCIAISSNFGWNHWTYNAVDWFFYSFLTSVGLGLVFGLMCLWQL